MIWRFACRTYAPREILVYRGLAAKLEGGELRLFDRDWPNPFVKMATSSRNHADVVGMIDGVLPLFCPGTVRAWDDVPWEIHSITDKIAREAAYRGWAGQNGAPSTDGLITRLNQWFGGYLYEI